MDETEDEQDYELVVEGKQFECICGCRLFRAIARHVDSILYRCNACGARYEGEV